jgi:hypothetical protein
MRQVCIGLRQTKRIAKQFNVVVKRVRKVHRPNLPSQVVGIKVELSPQVSEQVSVEVLRPERTEIDVQVCVVFEHQIFPGGLRCTA